MTGIPLIAAIPFALSVLFGLVLSLSGKRELRVLATVTIVAGVAGVALCALLLPLIFG
ncbi:hypothetical protein [Leucobacter sp. cx-169]|uniref:hypothetical protein n=1 Tax=Leucobacter sp. cx-169 TaxID=2770549 RepID=UPI00165D8AAE|nr:hypothetical protein [Leucobacter sp. cx-169]MBC9927227.1 hypothetical protein [Leucobacter sp. cx-169]